MDMGFETMPDMDLDRLSEVEVEGEGYSLYCKRGKRGGAKEDRYSATMGLQGKSKQAFFGVFDGHGGVGAAEFASKNLDRNIMKEVERRTSEEERIEKEHYSNYASCLSIVELLQIVERDLRGPDIDNLSIIDLVHLEEQLQAALMGARSTKTHMMLQSISSLHEKVCNFPLWNLVCNFSLSSGTNIIGLQAF
ncbi:probable phosphatase 2C 25 [Olea europaea subsp. europaea]|uniref:Probable phosphatase 2C 25 n=2 Tax=Olea europaea subsp. europaea TaxID=158383 RepID=A0A8S0PU39_OLEEU|nr:probable phosphatase 2C 25 [Olea europaea subsp. europaea]